MAVDTEKWDATLQEVFDAGPRARVVLRHPGKREVIRGWLEAHGLNPKEYIMGDEPKIEATYEDPAGEIFSALETMSRDLAERADNYSYILDVQDTWHLMLAHVRTLGFFPFYINRQRWDAVFTWLDRHGFIIELLKADRSSIVLEDQKTFYLNSVRGLIGHEKPTNQFERIAIGVTGAWNRALSYFISTATPEVYDKDREGGYALTTGEMVEVVWRYFTALYKYGVWPVAGNRHVEKILDSLYYIFKYELGETSRPGDTGPDGPVPEVPPWSQP